MNHDKLREQIFALYDGWVSASKKFFAKPDVQSSEFFVNQTMARIREENSKAERRAFNPAALWRWFAPAFSLALISVALLRPFAETPTLDVVFDDSSKFVLGGQNEN